MSYGNIDYGNGIRFSYGHLFDRLFRIYLKYWWLRSPDTRLDDSAYYVRSSGSVSIGFNYGVSDSYGRVQSPNTDGDSWVCCVHSSGFVGDGHNHVNYNSYGSPDRRLTDNGYFCNQYGYIAYDDYGVQYSYGKSPYTYYSHYACLVILSGDVDNYDYNYGDGSYGAQVSPVTPYDSVAFYIFPSGSVYDNGGFDNVDDDSYGRIQSPVTVNSDYAWSVTSSGTFFGDGIVINSSYGMNHSIVFYGNFRAN